MDALFLIEERKKRVNLTTIYASLLGYGQFFISLFAKFRISSSVS